MSIEKVRAYLEKHNIADRIQQFDVSSATVTLAAQALNCEPARIAKSLAFKTDDSAILVVTAGDAKIDNVKFKSFFGFKSKMLPPEEVEYLIGHKVGGVCPFAINEGINVYTDISLKRFNTVFPACGADNSSIEVSCDELFDYSNSVCWVDVCKGWANL